jgi:hypothetical protein
LQDEDKEIEGDKELLIQASDYYKNLFGYSVENNFELDEDI